VKKTPAAIENAARAQKRGNSAAKAQSSEKKKQRRRGAQRHKSSGKRQRNIDSATAENQNQRRASWRHLNGWRRHLARRLA